MKTLHPKSIVVTGGAGKMETEDVFKVLGYPEVIESEGVEWFDHNKAPFVAVDLTFGPQRRVMVNPRVLTYEKLVSLAQLKVHSTATVTLAIKNVAMSYPAADFYGHPRVKQELHPHNILVDKQAFLVGMLMRFPIDLAIVTGHPAMIGTGPVGGKAVETGLVIAGRNPVSVDSVAAHLLGFETLASSTSARPRNSASAYPSPRLAASPGRDDENRGGVRRGGDEDFPNGRLWRAILKSASMCYRA